MNPAVVALMWAAVAIMTLYACYWTYYRRLSIWFVAGLALTLGIVMMMARRRNG